jgi:hypothetical protein
MTELLTNETKALQNLQALKLSAHQELHVEKTEQMLRQMAQPLVWQLSHGETASVHTPETQRAKQLLDLFHALHAPVMSTDQRLDVLLKVKVRLWCFPDCFVSKLCLTFVATFVLQWVVGEAYSAQSMEIQDLVDREADLLSRNRPLKSMEKLRSRLGNLFLQFLQNSDVNPRAADFIKETV